MTSNARSRVLFLYYNPHPSHRAFAETVRADFLSYDHYSKHKVLPRTVKTIINGAKIPDYDVYLTEGGAPLAPLAIKKLIKINKKRKLLHINLISDHTFIMMQHTPKELAGQYNSYTNLAHRFASRYIDGAIAVSDFAKQTAEIFIDVPIRVVHPFIEDDLYRRLSLLKPNVNSRKILSVGSGLYKGMDILVNAFRIVKEDLPDAELHIIGRGHPNKWNDISGVHVAGYVDDLIPYLENASLFVQSSRADTFPVSTLESLRAGLPTIVTDKTGTMEVISDLGPEFIRRVDEDDIAEGILHYFDQSDMKRERLSDKAKIISKKFNRSEMCKNFKREFEALIEDLR